MKLYSAKIRLGGNADNEVIRDHMSAAELKVLEFIHAGKSPVLVDVKHTADVDRTEARERVRLAQIYSKSTQNGYLSGGTLVEKLFGVSSAPLPQDYEAPVSVAIEVFDVEGEGEDEVITPVAPEPAIVQTKAKSKLDELTG